MASSGVQTIGSPLTLNDVLRRTGTPVSASNALRRFQVARIVRARHGLDPRGAVDVRDGRNPRPLGLADAADDGHER